MVPVAYSKIVGVDATPLMKVKGGVGFYVNALLEEIVSISPSYLFVLFCPKRTADIDKFEKFKNIRIANCDFLGNREAVWSQSTLVYLLHKHKPDAFWGTTQSIPLLSSLRIPCILTIHDFTYLLHPETMSVGRRIYLQLLSRLIISAAHFIVANSYATAAKLAEFYDRRTDAVVIPPIRKLPIPDDSAALEVLAQYDCKPRGYCLCVASFEPRKNLESLINNYLSLVDDGRVLLPLVIIGGNGWKNANIVTLMDYCRKHYISQVIFLEFVDDFVMSAFLRNARLLVMPSLYEGYGMPIAEARMVGVPIMATDIPEHREAAESDGLFFDPENIKEALGRYVDLQYKHTLNSRPRYSSINELSKILLKQIDRAFISTSRL